MDAPAGYSGHSAMIRAPGRRLMRRPGYSVCAALKIACASLTLAARPRTFSIGPLSAAARSSMRYGRSPLIPGWPASGGGAPWPALPSGFLPRVRPISVSGSVPPRHDVVVVPKRDAAVWELPRRGIVGGKADAAVGGDRQDLLDRGPFRVPKLHFVGKVFAFGRLRKTRAGRPGAALSVIRRMQPALIFGARGQRSQWCGCQGPADRTLLMP